jgi:hypothetical protein
LILKSEKLVFIIKVLNLLIGSPNDKYPPNNKNYLKCLLFGEGGLVLGGRDYSIECSGRPKIRAQKKITAKCLAKFRLTSFIFANGLRHTIHLNDTKGPRVL